MRIDTTGRTLRDCIIGFIAEPRSAVTPCRTIGLATTDVVRYLLHIPGIVTFITQN